MKTVEFSIGEKEMKKVYVWIDSLPDLPEGAIGGRYKYMFTPTGIGLVVEVLDVATGQILDATDYDSW